MPTRPRRTVRQLARVLALGVALIGLIALAPDRIDPRPSSDRDASRTTVDPSGGVPSAAGATPDAAQPPRSTSDRPARSGAEPAAGPSGPPSPLAPTRLVALIVLDDVRADRTSLCGHARPTTPFLAETCERPGATCRCRAYAPGSWTIPSHASFFTGLEVQDHGVGSPDHPEERGQVFYRTLPTSVPTLAGTMAARGFRTVAISGNPVLDERSGLLRGFEERRVAKSFTAMQGERLVEALREVLALPDPERRPLFLFVNVADAHEPWLPVPEGLDWLPRRRYLRFDEPLDAYRARFMRGSLAPSEAEALERHVADVYDYGVYRADATLRQLFAALRETGWLAGSHRVAITSDHGELLGEASAFGHGAPLLYEGLSRVPLVFLTSEDERPALLEPLTALTVFDLLRGDALPPRPTRAAAWHAPGWQKRYGERWAQQDGAAIWRSDARAMLVDGAYLRFARPALREAGQARHLGEAGEAGEVGVPLETGPDRRELEAMARALEAAVAAPLPEGSEAISAHLRALGYVE